MHINYSRTLPLVIAGALALSARADQLAVGYFSYNITSPGATAEFDIINQTGPNSSTAPDTTFPVTTPVSFSSLSMLVDFTSGPPVTYDSSTFTTALDGLSFNGGTIPIGGTNPQPIDATLTGMFSPTTVTLNDGSVVTIGGSFSASITSNPNGLQDGDLAIIYATTGSTATPEPGTWALLGGGLLLLVLTRLPKRLAGFRRIAGLAAVACVGLIILAPQAFGATAVKLNTATAPDNGVAGITTVNITGSGFPSGTDNAANVVVVVANTCGGSVAATTKASSIKRVIGTSERVGFLIPGTLVAGNYFVSISDNTGGDAAFTSSNCSAVKVTHTNPTLSACIPTSSLAVLAPSKPGPVVAYVPNGAWDSGNTGIQVVPVEGGGSPSSIATPNAVNSCSSNPATGGTVCTANNTDVYLISGTSLNRTLTSGSNTQANFSGGSCNNCGVAINALTNKAVIAMGLNGATSGTGIQFLDLNTNTLAAPIPTNNYISENISIDPTRNLILSPDESNNYALYQIQSDGSTIKEFGNSIPAAGEMDSAAEDCSTGIALSSIEGTSSVYITDLTQAVFNSGSSTWSAPGQVQTLPGTSFSAGTDGISVAPGSAHLGIVTGEFGGNTFAVFQLPATSGTGTPSILDFAFATMPNIPSFGQFVAGDDPHTVTAYTSPNDSKAYGLMANSSPPSYLGVIDLAALLAAPRVSGSNTVDPSYDLLAHGVVRYVATH